MAMPPHLAIPRRAKRIRRLLWGLIKRWSAFHHEAVSLLDMCRDALRNAFTLRFEHLDPNAAIANHDQDLPVALAGAEPIIRAIAS